MKKLLLVAALLSSSWLIGLPAETVHAVGSAGTITVSYDNVTHQYVATPTRIAARVGDTITVQNDLTGSPIDVGSNGDPGEGALEVAAGLCQPFQGEPLCNVAPNGGTTDYTVRQFGIITVEDGSSHVLTFEVVAQSSHRPSPKHEVTFDPTGGVCSSHSEPWTVEFRGSYDLPTSADCTREGYRLLGWARTAGDVAVGALLTEKVSRDASLFAYWKKIEPPIGASVLVNFLCADCSQAAVSWSWPTPNGQPDSYEVVLSSRSSSTGEYSVESTTSVDAADIMSYVTILSNLKSGVAYRIELFSVEGGVRSTPALFSPVASASASISDDLVSSIDQTKSPSADFVIAAPNPTIVIVIVCGRTTVSGKPGVECDGATTGLGTGTTLIPMVKLPGQIEYSAGSARPAVDAQGNFYWSRKTGKKVYVYFKVENSSARSNNVIIPSN